jgi:hypothetical protein
MNTTYIQIDEKTFLKADDPYYKYDSYDTAYHALVDGVRLPVEISNAARALAIAVRHHYDALCDYLHRSCENPAI